MWGRVTSTLLVPLAVGVASCVPTSGDHPQAPVDPSMEIAKLPAPLRERFETPAGQREMRRALEDKALLIAEAKRQGYADLPEVQSAVRLLEERLAVQALLNAEREKLSISEEERRQYFEHHLTDFQLPERRAVRRLLCAVRGDRSTAQRCADDALIRLKSGARFEDIAKNGDGAERLNEGRLGPRRRTDFDHDVGDAIFAASKGQVVGPLWGRDGAQLFRIDDVLPATVRPYEQVKADIDHRLQPTLERRAFERLLGTLKAERQQ